VQRTIPKGVYPFALRGIYGIAHAYCHAIAHADVTEKPFERPDGFDAVEYLSRAMATLPRAVKTEILLHTDIATARREITEVLDTLPECPPVRALPLRVTYQEPCHLAHAQGVREEPRALLATIPKLELLEVQTEPEVCCGSAGIYNLLQPEAAAALGERKAQQLLATGAEAVAAGNPGCAAQLDLHLRELGCPLPIHHPVELVSRSITAARSR